MSWTWAPYQMEYLRDQSMQRCVNKARRIGFSEVVAFRKACRAVGVDLFTKKQTKPVDVNFISAGHEQAKDLLKRALYHVKALGLAFPGELVETDSATLARLTSGSALRAFSSNPRTIRAYGGDVVLDEYAAVPNADKVWKAAAPLARPTLGNPVGYELDVISTPDGDDNMFYRICRGDMSSGFSQHEVDIHRAIREGFPLRDTLESMREESGDPDMFSQEYECSFLAAAMRYISASLYDAQVYHPEQAPEQAGALYAGMDVARRKHNSVILIARKIIDVLWHTSTESAVDKAWDDQEEWVAQTLAKGVRRMHLDSSSIGDQFAERLTKKHAGRIEGTTFTLQSKEVLATGLKLALSRGRFRPMAGDSALRKACLAIKRIVTQAANIRYDAPVDKHGHADHAWAAALMLQAARSGVTMPVFTTRAQSQAKQTEVGQRRPGLAADAGPGRKGHMTGRPRPSRRGPLG